MLCSFHLVNRLPAGEEHWVREWRACLDSFMFHLMSLMKWQLLSVNKSTKSQTYINIDVLHTASTTKYQIATRYPSSIDFPVWTYSLVSAPGGKAFVFTLTVIGIIVITCSSRSWFPFCFFLWRCNNVSYRKHCSVWNWQHIFWFIVHRSQIRVEA